MQDDDEGDVDARVRDVVLAADPTRGQPIGEPAVTAAALRARLCPRRSRRRMWSPLW